MEISWNPHTSDGGFEPCVNALNLAGEAVDLSLAMVDLNLELSPVTVDMMGVENTRSL